MAQITREQVLEYLSTLKAEHLTEFIQELEQRWDLTADEVTVTGTSPEVAQVTCDVVLTSFGKSKIKVIMVIRALTGLGLKEAKYAADNLPHILLQGVDRREAEQAKTQLESVGGSVMIH
jgi:large subunit ribosomal protein L7/L12